jgi:hypothetical protein
MSYRNRLGARAGPDDVQGGGYSACPGSVIETTATPVCFETADADPQA